MPDSHVFILTLLCVCAAVNVLLYVSTTTPTDKAYRKLVLDGAVQLNPRNTERTRQGNGYMNQASVPRYTLPQQESESHTDNNFTPVSTNRKLHNAHVSSRDQRTFEYRINPHEACTKNATSGSELWEMVIVVVSKFSNFLYRDAIRNTWGSTQPIFNTNKVNLTNVKVLFLVGTDGSGKLQSQIEKEAELYEDIIQVDIEDEYSNLTYKSIAMLQWLIDYCANSRFYFKADDDIYANVDNILHNVTQIKQQRFFFCHVFKEAPPIRDIDSKWYVSKEEFSDMYFPTYCSGSAYVFDKAVLHGLYKSSVRRKILTMEDVYITGISAQNQGISHIHDGAFAFYKRTPTGCAYENAFTGHQVTPTQMFIVFAQLQSKEIDCETNVNRYLQRAEEND